MDKHSHERCEYEITYVFRYGGDRAIETIENATPAEVAEMIDELYAEKHEVVSVRRIPAVRRL